MHPFLKNLQKILIVFFTAIPAVIIIAAILRSKDAQTISSTSTSLAGGTSGASEFAPISGATSPMAAADQQKQVIINGKTYQTPYGSVSASITVAGSKIIAVSMPQVPDSPPSIYAEPYLVKQALAAGSANIQGVSGATYTSLAFKSSLESAIVQAKVRGQAVAPTTTTTSTVSSPTAPSVPRRYRDDDDDDDD